MVNILGTPMIIKNKKIQMIRKIISFTFVILLLFSFCSPVVVYADNYSVINIDDIIFVSENVDSGRPPYGNHYGRYSYHQVFMMRILLMAGLDRESITEEKLDDWESYVYKAYYYSDEIIVWNAVEKFMSQYVNVYYGDNEILTKVCFSSRLIISVDFWLWVWNQQNDTTLVNPLISVEDYNNIVWNSNDIYITYSWNYLLNAEQADNFILQPLEDWEVDVGGDLFSIFTDIKNGIDIDLLTSWLPDLFATPFIVYWGLMMTLCLVLVVLKVLHG